MSRVSCRAFFFVFALLFNLSACASGGGNDECQLNSDCENGRICVANACVQQRDAQPQDSSDMGQDALMDTSTDGAADASPDTNRVDTNCDAGLGDVCCVGNTCGVGACLSGICAAFGGVYAQAVSHDSPPPNNCTTGNPFANGQCECPAGFVAEGTTDMDIDYDEGSGYYDQIYVCVPPTPTLGDFAGAYGQVVGPLGDRAMCQSPGCTNPNPITGTCGCSPSTIATRIFGSRVQRGTTNDCATELTFCASNASGVSFGGAFATTQAGGNCNGSCIPNPLNNMCGCPGGFTEWRTPMKVQEASTTFRCNGEVVVCLREP